MSRTLFAALFLSLSGPIARAQEPLPVPRPFPVPAQSVRMTRLAVSVAIVDGVASTTLKQTWRNDGAADAEAVWVLPLPEGAVADGFTMTVNGVPMTGEVLGADAARGVYESIVRSRRDPGLLEYLGRGCLRARIFPIPPRGEVVVDVGYRALLPELLGLRKWSFALQAAGAGGIAPESVVLDLSIRSRKPIKNAYAPLGAIQVIQKDDHEVRASYEGSAAALGKEELAVFYGLSDAEFGLDLLTHRGAEDAEGTFLMLLSPKREWERQEVLRKSIVFVLDTSGSMEGEKMKQAKLALEQFLRSLGPDDVFDVVPFATEPEPFFGTRVPATGEKVAEALGRMERLVAAGGTNIDGALAAALRGDEAPAADGRVPILVFLTDGEPTVGETQPEAIRTAVKAANARGARLFVLGVGAGVNTHLLDALAEENGGARDYVREGERIDERTRALFAKLSHPVMTDLVLTIDGLAPTKVVPARLPDLFAGDRLEVFGRYAGEGGAHAIRLSGVVRGERKEYVYEGTFPRTTTADTSFLAPLWAERRVGVLLDAIRLNGANPELVQEVERLGREYRIVTPYTSHLVVEPGLRVAGRGFPGSPGPRTGGGGAASGPAGPTSPGSGPGSPGAGAPGLTAAERDALRSLGYSDEAAPTGADGFYLGHGARRSDGTSLAALAVELKRAGVLPEDADGERLARLTLEVARELRASEARLDALGKEKTGARAVDDSQYLATLVARGKHAGGGALLLDLFTRRVQTKTFVLRGGVWIDQSLPTPLPESRRKVEAFSDAYFALLAERPALAPYLALGTRVVVGVDGDVVEVTEPRS